MEAIVLAGGKGTRLQSIVSDVPKPLAPIGSKPFLDYLLKWLEYNGISRVVLSIGYKGNLIKNNYGTKFGKLNIEYCCEDIPLGTGGAIKKSMQFCQAENVFVMNGDSFFNIELATMQKHHIKNLAGITIAVKEMHNYKRYGTVVVSEGVVKSFCEKQHTECGFINGGIYIIRRDIFRKFDLPDVFSFEKDFMCKYKLQIHAMPFAENFIDIGISEDYALAQTLIPQWTEVYL